MRTKPNVSIEYHDALYRSLDDEACNAMRIVRSVLPCSECGSEDGMQGGWTREALKHVTLFPSKRPALFYLQSDDHQLFYPCWQCNPDGIIPDDFTPLPPEQVVAWCAVECMCPDCVRERNDGE